MCLGVPARVVEVRGEIALVDFGGGVLREVYVSTLEEVKPGDYVIVHAGIAIEKIKYEEYKALMEELERILSGGEGEGKEHV